MRPAACRLSARADYCNLARSAKFCASFSSGNWRSAGWPLTQELGIDGSGTFGVAAPSGGARGTEQRTRPVRVPEQRRRELLRGLLGPAGARRISPNSSCDGLISGRRPRRRRASPPRAAMARRIVAIASSRSPSAALAAAAISSAWISSTGAMLAANGIGAPAICWRMACSAAMLCCASAEPGHGRRQAAGEDGRSLGQGCERLVRVAAGRSPRSRRLPGGAGSSSAACVPLLRLHQEGGGHGRLAVGAVDEVAHVVLRELRQGSRASSRAAARLVVAALLQIGVEQPVQAVEIGLRPIRRGLPRGLVRGGGLRPHPELQEDVRRHVQRVGRRRRDLGVAPRGRQSQDGVVRVVERVEDVVRRARMVGFLAVDLLGDRGGAHPGPQSGRVAGAAAVSPATFA